MEVNKIIAGDCLEELKKLPDNCIDCCSTSPPYFGLRDYGTATWIGGDQNCDHQGEPMRTKAYINENCGTGEDKKNKQNNQIFKNICGKCGAARVDKQIGLEKTPELYVLKMVEVFTEVRRVLKKEGTLWLNLGDTYAAYWGQNYGQGQSLSGTRENNGSAPPHKESPKFSKSKRNVDRYGGGNVPAMGEIKPKDLFGIPWMVAFALRSSGWYLRQDIIWSKKNPMPESVTDRCTKSHEYIFLLSKSAKYYYDAESIATPYQDKTLTTFGNEVKGKGDGSGLIQSENWANSLEVRKPKVWKEKAAEKYGINGTGFQGHSGNFDANGNLLGSGKANKRSVWTVSTQPYAEAHFATFPEDLVVDMIKAGCPEGGIVLDPFGGAGTTALVAAKLNRKFYLIELKPEYIKIAEKRLRDHLGFFNPAY